MAKYAQHTGKRFGYLTVLREFDSPTSARDHEWICRCDCGKVIIVPSGDLRSRHTSSCGCFRSQVVAAKNTTHGLSRRHRAELKVWCGMRRRCQDPKSRSYKDYGGRGITVCPEWEASFEQFLKDVGARPSSQHSLERDDNDGPYAPWNCRWATPTEQAGNRRSNTMLTFQGRRLPLSQWAREVRMSPNSLLKRLSSGWPVEKALTTPLQRSADAYVVSRARYSTCGRVQMNSG